MVMGYLNSANEGEANAPDSWGTIRRLQALMGPPACHDSIDGDTDAPSCAAYCTYSRS